MQPVTTSSLPMPAARPPEAASAASARPAARGQAVESTKFDDLVASALAGTGPPQLASGQAPGSVLAALNAGGGPLPPDGHPVAARVPDPVTSAALAGRPAGLLSGTAGSPAWGAGRNTLAAGTTAIGAAIGTPGPVAGEPPGLPRISGLADMPRESGAPPGAGILLRVREDGVSERRPGADTLVAAPEHLGSNAPRSPGLEPVSTGAAHRAVPLPVDQPAVFGERLSHHVSVMLTQHAQSARIAVTPPDLGPVDVRVVVVGDEASVQLISPHAATRDALEEALPRLRAMFADSGLVLDQAGVFSETPKQQHHAYADHQGDGRPAASDASASVSEAGVRVSVGLIDAFV